MRRRYGTGSIYQRGTDGRWIGAVTIGPKRKRLVVSSQTREGVEEKMAWLHVEHPPREPSLSRKEAMAAAKAIADHTEKEWWAKVRALGRACTYCGVVCTVTGSRARPTELEQDHMIPLTRGGSNGIDNVTPACSRCNKAKGHMTADEFVAARAS